MIPYGTAEIKLDDETWQFPRVRIDSLEHHPLDRCVTVSFTGYLAPGGEDSDHYMRVTSNDEPKYAVIKFWDGVYRKVEVGHFVIDDDGKFYEVGGSNVLFPYDVDDMQVYTPEEVIPTMTFRAVEPAETDQPKKFTKWTLCKIRDVGGDGPSYAEVKGSKYRFGPGRPEFDHHGVEILEVIKEVE